MEQITSQVNGMIEQALETFRLELGRAADLERLKRKQQLTASEVQALYGLNQDTMETWRCRGGGPDYVKVGKLVFYRHDDIQRFLDSRRVKGRA